jgi:hypothetical protein
MQGIFVALLIIGAALSIPIEARLWRAGRLSDRVLAILLLGRLPVVLLLFGIIQGYSVPFALATSALALMPTVLFHRYLLALLAEQRSLNR